jgi:hypothetical protein
MQKEVIRISAIGSRGDAKGKIFIAKEDSSGKYVLNRKRSSSSTNPTNKAVNKVYVNSLTEAASLLATGDYLINLVDEHGVRALRALNKVKIEYG